MKTSNLQSEARMQAVFSRTSRKSTTAVFALAISLALGAGCASGAKKSAGEQKAQAEKAAAPLPLTHEESANRFHQILHPAYRLFFAFTPEKTEFDGRTVVSFDLKPKAKDHGKTLFLDFEGGQIHSISLNGKTLGDAPDKSRYDGHRVYFKLEELAPTANRVEIAFTHPFAPNGNGLYRFQDPSDHRVYLYSNDEPYYANRIFPCFDQPDLKATYELTVEAPQDWKVISNTLERGVTPVDGRKSWSFPQTPLLSTYLFAVIAGPYQEWKGDADGIPMRLFARKSLAQFVDAKEWLDITRGGLAFYGETYGYNYPFAKYDQILSPDFNVGAMENAGAVTFTEKYIFRTKVTQDRHLRRAETILHEMAHMWFGDLVTMKWWNGLWLNESFATFMSAWAVDKSTSYKGAWQAFFGEKTWAYWEDQLVTTHPIEVPVPDTDTAFSNFDGITYGKGASSLKQLFYYLGEDDFREGVQRYFQRYAYKNTTINDFMKMLAEASGKDLSKWQHQWLQTTGVNTVRADWACENGTLRKLDLIQSPSEGNTEIRTHRTKLGLFQLVKGKYHAQDTIETTYDKAVNPVSGAIGKACPAFIYPNFEDYDYAKAELDPITLAAVQKDLAKIDDAFTRQLIWHDLHEMMIDGKLRAQDYIDTAIAQLSGETDTKILATILRSLEAPDADFNSALKFLSGDQRAAYRAKLESFVWKGLEKSKPGSDPQLIWYGTFRDVAYSPKAVQYFESLLSKKTKLTGIPLDQERRWEIIQVLARNGASGAAELIASEQKADPTDNGQNHAIAAQASLPDSAMKSHWFDQIAQYPAQHAADLSFNKLREAMRNLNVLGHEDLIAPLVERYFQILSQVTKAGDEEYDANYIEEVFPSLCTQDIVDRTAAALKSSDLPSPVIKQLKIRKQEEERCVRARAKSLSQ